MSVRITHDSEDSTRIVAAIEGEIDHHSAKALREEIDRYIERAKPSALTLDLNGVSFMDSSGVGLIMGRYKLMSELGGTLYITGASHSIARMIKLAGLSRLGISIS